MTSIDVDFWANGADPFVINWGNYTFHIHAGPRPPAAGGGASAGGGGAGTGGTAAGTGGGTTNPVLTIPDRPELNPPLALRFPGYHAQLADWVPRVAGRPARIQLDTHSGDARFDLESLLGELTDLVGEAGETGPVRYNVVAVNPADQGGHG